MDTKENDSENENVVELKSDQKRSKNRSPSPDVKSTAVVKYTAFHSPVSYSRLQCNTDLNLPPSNWGAPNDSYGSREILTGETGLSSFRMAHMFPDCVGEVDVISSAECIKNLLKLPYQPNGTISMMVHRVENTLLLDDFVYDYLMKSEWSWLKEFYKENILKTMSEQERSLMLIPSPSTSLQLTHKFLSHSVAGRPEPAVRARPQPMCRAEPFLADAKPEVTSNEHLYNRNVHWTFEDIHMLIGSDLPIFGDKDRPCVSLRLRDAREPINVLTGIDYWLDNLMCNVPEVLMCYHLDGIVQKYEPMKTEDLPHIENSRFSPKVIRNVAQNILSFLKSNATKAGHTYWLFKGPHDDVVKLYDLTSLCPDNLDNPFTTPVAMLLYRVAKSMVIQNRCKRHVKQLLENVIGLLKEDKFPQIVASSQYMLSGLYVPGDTDPACPDFKDENFDSDETDQDYTDACEGETTPERDDNTSPKTDENLQHISKCKQDRNTPSGESERDEDDNALAVQIRGLSLNNIGDRARNIKEHKLSEQAGLGSNVPARCGRALQHALRGLRALALLSHCTNTEEGRERLRQQIISEEQNPKMANPFEPIQMDYQPIQRKDKKEKEHASRSRRRKRDRKISEKSANSLIETNTNIDKNAILIRKEKRLFPPLTESNRDDNYAWKLHLKILLYEKICLAYATLAEYSYTHEQYGFSLKYIDIASKCQKLLSNMIIKSRVVASTCLIGRVGDNYFQLSKHWGRLDIFRKQFETDHETDSNLKQEIENDLVEEVDGTTTDEFDLDITMPSTESTSMLLACSHYRRAVEASDGSKQSELLRRLASVTNELAVRYMNEGQQIYMKYVEEEDADKAERLLEEFESLSRKSEQCLDEATKIFERVGDAPNLALLYCNRARYMRFRAHCDSGGFTVNKLSLYSRGEELYLSALKLLGGRESCGAASVWELVSWELSCHTYTKATLMQDCPDVYASEVSEVADAFKQALKYCLLSPGPRQESYQFRAAKIYHKMASLYHSQFRITTEEGPKRRSLYQQTFANYALAANMLAALGDAREYLLVQLEHVAATEYRAATTSNLKLKSLQTALQLLCQCHSVIQIIKDRDPEDAPTLEEEDAKSIKNEASLLALFEHRLHSTLKNIIQYCRSKSNKDYERMTEMYKKLYCASLKITKSDDLKAYAASVCQVLENIEAITKGYEQS